MALRDDQLSPIWLKRRTAKRAHRVCEVCGASLAHKSLHHKYCKPDCKQRAIAQQNIDRGLASLAELDGK